MEMIKIVVLKHSGQQIIAKVEHKGDQLILTHPHFVKLTLTPSGGEVAFFDVLQMGKSGAKTLELFRDDVLHMYEPDDQILSRYNQAFGSGLIVPKSGPQLIHG